MLARTFFRLNGLALTVLLCGQSFTFAQQSGGMMMPPLLNELTETARDHSNNQRWNEAINSWIRVLQADRSNEEAKTNLLKCVRFCSLVNRHRDPNLQAKILALPQSEVMALYGEIIKKIQTNYVDPSKIAISKLFQQGLVEFLTSLDDPGFAAAHLKIKDKSQIASFRARVERAWSDRQVTTLREAQEVLGEVASVAKRELGMRSGNAVILEFICGACNSLDEYSAYLNDTQLSEKDRPYARTTVQAAILEGNVAHIRINRFDTDTADEIDAALKGVSEMGKIKALIIDLRGNMGGDFLAAIKSAQRFLSSGIIVTAQGQNAENTKVFTSNSGAAAVDLPAVTLVNADTASSAEVFAIALRDNQRARIVGMPTFGKGLLQNVIRFDSPVDSAASKGKSGANVRLTVARLLSPAGNPIAGVGLVPDVTERDPERQMDIAIDQARELARRYMGQQR